MFFPLKKKQQNVDFKPMQKLRDVDIMKTVKCCFHATRNLEDALFTILARGTEW